MDHDRGCSASEQEERVYALRNGSRRTPLLILCGFLGSGKTTFVQHLIQSSETLRRYSMAGTLLLFVNDLAPENVDAAAMMMSITTKPRTDCSNVSSSTVEVGAAGAAPSALGVVAALSNGCVCCNLLPDFLRQLTYAVAPGASWEYIILECSGVADAAPVAAAIVQSAALRSRVCIDAVVTILDAAHALDHGRRGNEQEQAIWESQLFGCNAVVLNKIDEFASHSSNSVKTLQQRGESSDNRCVEADEGGEDAWISFKNRVLRAARRSNPLVKLWCTNYSQLAAVDTLLVQQNLFERHNMPLVYQQHAMRLLEGARNVLLSSSGNTYTAPSSSAPHVDSGEGNPHGFIGELLLSNALPTRAALEVGRLGLTTTCVRLAVPGVSAVPTTADRAPRRVLHLSRWLDAARKIFARHTIIRSKGFFFAADDVGPQEPPMATEDCATGSATVMPQKQFSWSSVEKDIQYALLLPPYITLPLQSGWPSVSSSLAAGAQRRQQQQRQEVPGDSSATVVEIVFIGHFEEVPLQQEWRAAFDASLVLSHTQTEARSFSRRGC